MEFIYKKIEFMIRCYSSRAIFIQTAISLIQTIVFIKVIETLSKGWELIYFGE